MYPNLAARNGILIVGGSPPRNKVNAYYEIEMQAKNDPRWKLFHWRIWNNSHISRAWIEEEKAAHYKRGDGDIWESEYEGNYVFGGKKAVFSVFDPEKNTLPIEVVSAIIGKDKGKLQYFIVSDPGNRACHANLFIALNPINNHVYILDEIYETNMAETATGRIVPRILAKANKLFPRIDYWIYDEAALWFATEMQAQFPDAPPLCPTNKAVRDKETSIGVIKDCMASGKYIHSHNCKKLEDEITGYYVDDGDKYVKKNDHAIDAVRYFFDFVGYSFQMNPFEKDLTPEQKFMAKLEAEHNDEDRSSLAMDLIQSEEFNFVEDGMDIIWN